MSSKNPLIIYVYVYMGLMILALIAPICKLNLILVLVLLIYLLSFVLPLMWCWLVVICGDALLFWLSGPLCLCLHVYMMCLLLYRHVYIGMPALVAYYELVLSYVSQW